MNGDQFVTAIFSSASPPVAVPNVVGLTQAAATSHVPMLSNLVLDVIRKAANAVQKSLKAGVQSGLEGNSDNCAIGPDRLRETVARRSLFLISCEVCFWRAP